ncbi:MAG: type III-B CRISPR module RAMP protein Cmr4 [Gammaproteobacteria bacterium]|nr:type III-B CRISPR module RAMP protein Cmr4 [Gammaproteobacteria bacterium]
MNSVWNEAQLTALYTLTPLHCGSGQAAAAVDLPIAREAGSDLPIIPATGLKGAAREALTGELGKDTLNILFGPELDSSEGASTLSAGAVTFTEARLVAYPVRSLNRLFLHVTCPLIVERLARDLRIAGLQQTLFEQDWQPAVDAEQALVADAALAGQALVLEDLVFSGEETRHCPQLQRFGQALAGLLPSAETATCGRLSSDLIMIPDSDFSELMSRIIPVRARIKLTDGKTTDEWISEEGEIQSGNLWYEEALPSDCLFLTLLGARRQRSRGSGSNASGQAAADEPLKILGAHVGKLAAIQLGGNETVGYGLCWWSGWDEPQRTGQGGTA